MLIIVLSYENVEKNENYDQDRNRRNYHFDIIFGHSQILSQPALIYKGNLKKIFDYYDNEIKVRAMLKIFPTIAAEGTSWDKKSMCLILRFRS